MAIQGGLCHPRLSVVLFHLAGSPGGTTKTHSRTQRVHAPQLCTDLLRDHLADMEDHIVEYISSRPVEPVHDRRLDGVCTQFDLN